MILVSYILFDAAISSKPNFALYTFTGIWRAIVKSIKENENFVARWNLFVLILRQLSRSQTSLLRCCVDIFIVTASAVLSARFRQFAQRIDQLIQAKVRKNWRSFKSFSTNLLLPFLSHVSRYATTLKIF